jgi:hypothetical protein
MPSQNKSNSGGSSFSFNFGENDEPKNFFNTNTSGLFQDLSQGNKPPKRNFFNFSGSLPKLSQESFDQPSPLKSASTGFKKPSGESFFKSDLNLPPLPSSSQPTKPGNSEGFSSATLKGLSGLFQQGDSSPLDEISSTAKGFGSNLGNIDFLFDGSAKATPPTSFNIPKPLENLPSLSQNIGKLFGLKETPNPIQPPPELDSALGNIDRLKQPAVDRSTSDQIDPNSLSDIISNLTGGLLNRDSLSQTSHDRTGNLNISRESLVQKPPNKTQRGNIDPSLVIKKLSNKMRDSDFDRDSNKINRINPSKAESRPQKQIVDEKEKIETFPEENEGAFSAALGNIGLSVIKATMGIPEKGLNILDFALKKLGGEERFKNSFFGKSSTSLRKKTFNRAKEVINKIQEINGKKLEKNGFLKAFSGTLSFVAEMAIEAPFDIATKLVSLPKDVIIDSSQTYNRVYDETLKQFKDLPIDDAKAKAESRASFAAATNLAPIIFKHLGVKAKIFQPKGNKLDPVREFFGNLINGVGSDAAKTMNENGITGKEDLLPPENGKKIITDNIQDGANSFFNKKLETKFFSK